MSESQEMIEVLVGLRSFVVPKVSEPYVRKLYYGTPEEKRLVIRPWPPKHNTKDLKKIIAKLEPQQCQPSQTS